MDLWVLPGGPSQGPALKTVGTLPPSRTAMQEELYPLGNPRSSYQVGPKKSTLLGSKDPGPATAQEAQEVGILLMEGQQSQLSGDHSPVESAHLRLH